ncbi:MAG: hypothetical protein A3D92_21295 [Bacteroidetes bacterium RIFCSPHIGHO2_02_FULL_44_7]|nr:MAG: hypothetical protein A3D92_21295 [Bacteroidetes bacterium RIFCSPHIGHO2_02_FULL_44_7]
MKIKNHARGYFQRSDKGPEIIQIQTQLKALGYWPDVAFNENFGPTTEAAVKKFQVAKSLKVDGLVGKDTLLALGFQIDSSGPTTAPKSGTVSTGTATDSSGGALLEFDHAAKQFKKVVVNAKYNEKYRLLIDHSKMPAPQLTKAKLIQWKLQAEGGLTNNKNDSASSFPCPTPYNGVSGYHTNKGVTYKVWVKHFPTSAANDQRFFKMDLADWSKIFDTSYWIPNSVAAYPEVINCLLVSFAWGGSKNPTVSGAESILGKSIATAAVNEAVAALLSARGQLFINISQPGNKNNAFRKGWVDNALNKLVREMYGA